MIKFKKFEKSLYHFNTDEKLYINDVIDLTYKYSDKKAKQSLFTEKLNNAFDFMDLEFNYFSLLLET